MRRIHMLALVLAVLCVALVMIGALKPAWYLRTLYPLRYPHTINAHADNYGLPADLVAAVIYQESKFDPRAESRAGAVGLMQVTPDTARGIARRTGGQKFQESDLLEPEINIRYGCWYLRHLHQRYDGGDDFTLALAAYNAGQGRVKEWIEAEEDGELLVSEIPFAETRAYVRRVLELRDYYERAYPVLD